MTRGPSAELHGGAELRWVTGGATVVAALLAIGSRWFAEVTWTLAALALAEILIEARGQGGPDRSPPRASVRRALLGGAVVLAAGTAASLVLSGGTSFASLPLAAAVAVALVVTRPEPAFGGGR